MLSIAAYGCGALEILTAYRGDNDGICATSLGILDVLADICFKGTRGGSATIVGSTSCSSITDTCVVCLDAVAIHTLRLLVVMGELDDDIVSRLDGRAARLLSHHSGPIGRLKIEGLAAGT